MYPAGDRATAGRSACPLLPRTSYWLGASNEMDSVKTLLIIVNNNEDSGLAYGKNTASGLITGRFLSKWRQKYDKGAIRFVNQFHGWLRKSVAG
jgi:hypothetical protein